MTPEQALSRLQDDLGRVLLAIAPGLPQPPIDTPPDSGIPCGGPLGNDASKVKGSLHGLIGPGGWDRDRTAAITRVHAVTDPLGYTLQPEQAVPAGAAIQAGHPDGQSFVLVFQSDGSVSTRASTACLTNPDA